MKLQARYNRTTIATTLLVLLTAAIGYYFLIHYVLIKQLDEDLKIEEVEIHDHISKFDMLPEATDYKDQRISFVKTDLTSQRHFHSLRVYIPEENEMEPSRQLQFTVTAGGQRYLASVTKSEEETENVVWIIMVVTIALMILLTTLLYLANRFVFNNLWKPFRSTLSSIKAFDLGEPSHFITEPTSITEFKELNESFRLMTQKVKSDYESLKNFTDHASHEMQTPLAVIHSKLDVLIQKPELSENSMSQIQDIYTAVDKLARLSQSLLLLTKIENKSYKEKHIVSLHLLVKEKINELNEWLSAKNLQVTQQIQPLEVSMNSDLADILVGNLLNNAIRHSEPGGLIVITIAERTLAIANSGTQDLDRERIFDRFAKSELSDGTGLGLAIVKEICEQYHLLLSYKFVDRQHIFSIGFPSPD